MEIQGRIALVTGANRGLGKAIAQALLQAGAAKVYAAARDPGKVDLPGVVPVQLDVTDPASARALAERCGDVDIVVNNAGISVHAPALGSETSDVLRRVLDTNLYGILNVSSAFAPVVGRNGGGAFVNVLSVLSWVALDGLTPYSVSKAGAWALTNGMRQELKSQNTQVTAVHVGYMDTDMAGHVGGPKTSPVDAAAQIVAAIRDAQPELLIDQLSKDVKASLGTPAAAYL
ncbi:SDR family oxidoreductase [Bordetella flabilis]|uniref:Short-chain dehydrogenase n=1 Tax=Bordetella flabilis TaxID=463014 RepID=A0A193GFN5_9BORD|nr:SDR family oxidoreductase [Bordetella flabilis]ANN78104.1 short-chain dehydrogenase [Bordetella flabilis]